MLDISYVFLDYIHVYRLQINIHIFRRIVILFVFLCRFAKVTLLVPSGLFAHLEVRDDVTPTTWVVVGYGDDGNIKNPLSVVAKGTGDIEALKQHFDDAQAMYALYRTSDTYDDIRTVKFVYIYWWVGFGLFFCFDCLLKCLCLQCFDAVGWAAGRASGL